MASVREIRRRITSVRNIAQVTRAMEMVAASRMRRAQEQALASRPYAAKAWEVLMHLTAMVGGDHHPLLTEPEATRTAALVVVSGDRGLAGAYNGNVMRAALRFVDANDFQARMIAVGRKGRDLLLRGGHDLLAEFVDLPARPAESDVAPIASVAIDAFLSHEVDCVYIAYTDFINVLRQEPIMRQLLPVRTGDPGSRVLAEFLHGDPPEQTNPYIYEQGYAELVDTIVPRFTELQIYQAILESLASEHSARMVAMRNATQNADELVDELTLSYNKARQEGITTEMLDIVGGAEALAS
ncbi:MAG: ATP synthase F1 subunit gamma [Spirochaetaceae bacterium]|nr:ATP synthase F1 subunit gamma [Spirochaetaceae bacterium]